MISIVGCIGIGIGIGMASMVLILMIVFVLIAIVDFDFIVAASQIKDRINLRIEILDLSTAGR